MLCVGCDTMSADIFILDATVTEAREKHTCVVAMSLGAAFLHILFAETIHKYLDGLIMVSPIVPHSLAKVGSPEMKAANARAFAYAENDSRVLNGMQLLRDLGGVSHIPLLTVQMKSDDEYTTALLRGLDMASFQSLQVELVLPGTDLMSLIVRFIDTRGRAKAGVMLPPEPTVEWTCDPPCNKTHPVDTYQCVECERLYPGLRDVILH